MATNSERIADKLQNIIDSKSDIRRAIIAKGGTVAPEHKLADYAEDILNIPTEGTIIQKTPLHDLYMHNVDRFTNLTVGQGIDGVLVHSSINAGYTIGYNGTSSITYDEIGYNSLAMMTVCANECIEDEDYIFTITKESNPSSTTVQRHFTVTGQNFQMKENYTGYTDYYISVPSGTTYSNINITFDGHYPQYIYLGARDNSIGRGEFIDNNGNILAISRGNLSTSDNSQFTRYEMTGDITNLSIRFTGFLNLGNFTGYFYIRVPSVVNESLSLSGEFSIKSKKYNKYLTISPNNTISWSSTKFNLTLEDYWGAIALANVSIVQPANVSENLLFSIKNIDTQQYISSSGPGSYNGTDVMDSNSVWIFYSLTK